MTRYDVAIIGGGITGCLAAQRLAMHGTRVALLDAGPDPSHPSFIEQAQRDKGRQHIQSQLYAYTESTAPFLVDDLDHPYTCPDDAPFLWFRGRQVGGRLHLWDGCCPRLTAAQLAKPRDDGLPTWPIKYSDLEPYYIEAERTLRVHVAPPGDFEHLIEEAIGREFPEARVIPRPVAKLNFAELRKELASFENLTIIPNAVVYKLVLSKEGGKIGCINYIDGSSRRSAELTPTAVVLCASTLESTRILLQSASESYPHGLGDFSGVLGKFLMDHSVGFLSEGMRLNERMRRRLRRFASESSSPPLEWPQGIYINREAVPGVRQYGCEAVFASHEYFWINAFGEVDSAAPNRVCLNHAIRDCWGLPTLAIELRYSGRDLNRIYDATEFCASVVEIANLVSRSYKPFVPRSYRRFVSKSYKREIRMTGSSIHEVGTARMGEARNMSFLNKFNQSWEVPNLFITDGSAFPASAYQNPTLTMAALTLRACDIITSELTKNSSLEPLVPNSPFEIPNALRTDEELRLGK
jgi:choline dehydrogenase-like flavoprotein